MKFSVIIPAYQPDMVAAPIQSVLRQTMPDWELLLVGQGELGSHRAKAVRVVAEELGADNQRLRYLHMDKPGQTAAMNVGIRHAQGEWIAILGDDCTAHPDWLATLAETFRRLPNVGVVGGAVHKPAKLRRGTAVCTNIVPSEAVYDPNVQTKAPAGWDWLVINMAMRREVVAQVGLFDEHLGPGTDFSAAGDTDYKLRLEAHGVVMATTPHAVVYHTHGYRFGLQAALQFSRRNAQGNGALAAKLTLMGDPRGQEWAKENRRMRWRKWKRPFRPHRLLFDIRRWLDFQHAYHHCLQAFEVSDGVLQPTGC